MKTVFNLKRILITISIVIFTLVLLDTNTALSDENAGTTKAFFVDCSAGSDTNDGSFLHPFKTIRQAQLKVRGLNRDMSSDITVYIRKGEYFLNETLKFDEGDSGNNGFNVIYSSYNGEKVEIVGGKRLTGWKPDSSGIYKIFVGDKWRFYDLYENGQRCVMARFPNGGYFNVEGPDPEDNRTKFVFKSSDIKERFDYRDAQVYFYPQGQWQADVNPITNIDWDTRTITTLKKSNLDIANNNCIFYLRGSKDFLDMPGEFYLDESSGYLYYKPRKLPITSQDIIAPTVKKAIEIKGSSSDNIVHNIRFIGLNISVSDFTKCNAGDTSINEQALIYLENSRNISIIKCNISNSGSNGILIRNFGQDNLISGNYINNICRAGASCFGFGAGRSGLKSYEEAYINKNNRIINNVIKNCGQILGHGYGVYIHDSGSNTISNNRISMIGRSGISISSSTKYSYEQDKVLFGIPVTYENHWDFRTARNNIISFNDISDIGLETRDASGIALCNTGKGNIVDNNRVHHINGLGYSMGIGFDDESDYIEVKNNIIYDVDGGFAGFPVFLKGVHTSFINNIVADNRTDRDINYFAENNIPNRFIVQKNNIFYREKGNVVYDFFDWTEDKVSESDRNLIYHPGGTITVKTAKKTISWTDWLKKDGKKYDKNSILTDPKFVDRSSRNYKLMSSSPAIGLGFKQINQLKIGPDSGFTLNRADDVIQMEKYNKMSGISNGETVISPTSSSAWARYGQLDFRAGELKYINLQLSMQKTAKPGTVQIRSDSLNGDLLGEVYINKGISYKSYTLVKAKIKELHGIHDIYIVFRNLENASLKLDWFRFSSEYYAESFENGMDGWTAIGSPVLSENQKVDGSYSLRINSSGKPQDKCSIQKAFDSQQKKVISLYVFDDINKDSVKFFSGDGLYGLGIDTGVSGKKYSYMTNGRIIATNILRSTGWHHFVLDFSSGTEVIMYIDGTNVCRSKSGALKKVMIGDFWNDGKASDIYIDDIRIFDNNPYIN